MRTAAVLPVKSFGRAKQRLGAAVGQPHRGELAAGMVADVLGALGAVPGLDDVIVVTAEPRAAAAAREAGAHVVDDPAESGQSGAAARGVAAAVARGCQRVLLVPGDCPALDAAEVGALLDGFGDADVVIVPDRHGSGTNALRLTPPDVIGPAFGSGSFARHAALAPGRERSCAWRRRRRWSSTSTRRAISAALRAALDRLPDAAPRTRALLQRLASRSTVA